MKNNLLPPKKIAAVHDLSGLGRCSLTVIIPMLSYMGYQVCPLPTALLSTHTGGYSGFSFLDLTDEIPKITEHWKNINAQFDAVYTGFLGSAGQIEEILDFATYYKNKQGSLFLADPVMGDDGEKYSTYTDEMCDLTAMLVKNADIITPNITEAAILSKASYKEEYSESEIKDLLINLSDLGSQKVIVTGIKKIINGKNKIGAVYFDKTTKEFGEYYSKYIDKAYPGAGDVFSCIVLGCALKGIDLGNSCEKAVNFLYKAVKYTAELQTPVREGLAIESLRSSIKID